jgi:tetratricopeptide (TPR) repeat protein
MFNLAPSIAASSKRDGISRLIAATIVSGTVASSTVAVSSTAAMAQQAAAGHAGSGARYTFQGRDLNETQYQALLKYNDSLKDIENGNWAAANEKLNQVVQMDPLLYQAHSNHALVLARLGQLEEAAKEAELACKYGPEKPEPIAAKAAVAQASGRLDDAANLYAEFSAKFPSHPMTAYARSLTQQLRAEVTKQQAIIASGKGKSDDYFDYATYDATTKWSADKMPLAVYVPGDQEAQKIPGYRKEFGEALRAAFADWAARSNEAISFVFVSSADKAQIACRWTNDPTQVAQPAEGGEAKVLYDPIHGIQHSNITLLTQQPDSMKLEVPVNLIRAASLHEVGHSLGLIGHSPDSGDVMFCSLPTADQPRLLTERDSKTLQHLYDPNVRMAAHFHEVDPSDKVSINNEGIKYASAQMYEKAAEKFEAVLKLDPNFEASKRNLAACLNNLGIEAARNGKYAEALKRLKRALELEGPNGDRQKRISILKNLALIYAKLNKPAEAQQARTDAARLMNPGDKSTI